MTVLPPSSATPGLVPGPNPLYETQMLGAMVAAILYGIVLMLAGNCITLLFNKNIAVASRSMRHFLVFFIVLMLLLSTLSLAQGMLVATTSIFGGFIIPSLPGGAPYVLPLSIWASDGFMLWRCAILYQGIARVSRVLLLCFISLVFMAALGSGFSVFFSPLTMHLPTLLIISFSTLFNVTVSVLIVVRLTLHQIYLRNVLGPGHGSPYTRVMAITVESAALLILVGIPYVFLVAYENAEGSMMLLSLLPQICSLSTLLIIYRVAQGKAAMEMPTDDRKFDKLVDLQLGAIQFDTKSLRYSNITLPNLLDFEAK